MEAIFKRSHEPTYKSIQKKQRGQDQQQLLSQQFEEQTLYREQQRKIQYYYRNIGRICILIVSQKLYCIFETSIIFMSTTYFLFIIILLLLVLHFLKLIKILQGYQVFFFLFKLYKVDKKQDQFLTNEILLCTY